MVSRCRWPPESLLNLKVQAALLAFDHLLRLRGRKSVPKLIVGGVRISPFQIFPDRSLEKDRLLRHNADHGAQLFQRVALHVRTPHEYLAARRIIKARD